MPPFGRNCGDHRVEEVSAFIAQRDELLGTLRALRPADWERAATVTSYGQANERTLRSYASQLAKHERTHVRQIETTLNPEPTKERHGG